MKPNVIKMRKCEHTGIYFPQNHFLVFEFSNIGHKIISKYNKGLWDEGHECSREEQRSINKFVKEQWEAKNEKS